MPVAAQLQQSPAAAIGRLCLHRHRFLVSARPLDNDALVSSLGLDMGFAGGGDLFVSYDGLSSGRVLSNTLKAQLNWAF